MIIGRKNISLSSTNSMNIFTHIQNLPDLVKSWAWQGEFRIGGQTITDLGLRCKKIEHNQGTNEFTLVFDEFEDFFATNTLDAVYKQSQTFDLVVRIYDSSFHKICFSKMYNNCIITSIDEFDLDLEGKDKLQLKVHCKF